MAGVSNLTKKFIYLLALYYSVLQSSRKQDGPVGFSKMNTMNSLFAELYNRFMASLEALLQQAEDDDDATHTP